SGNETSAHLHENGRLTFMFCAFEGAPRILRLFGQGRAVLPSAPEWAEVSSHFPHYINTRQIILADISLVQTSCGYAVPLLDFAGDRDTLQRWAATKSQDELSQYQCEKNAQSLDGLPTPLGLALKD
ncbi:MAG TPA: hypothetical protein VHO69_07720, partial [Phototrophicaceae bacterium]|nr:hypothetical protein [Phototrophicaceae bacterium]